MESEIFLQAVGETFEDEFRIFEFSNQALSEVSSVLIPSCVVPELPVKNQKQGSLHVSQSIVLSFWEHTTIYASSEAVAEAALASRGSLTEPQPNRP